MHYTFLLDSTYTLYTSTFYVTYLRTLLLTVQLVKDIAVAICITEDGFLHCISV